MLPPLGAALSASVDYQTAGRHVTRPPVAATAAASVPSLPSPVSYLSGGRLDLLSLPGQLHLAQGLSIFAETVGNYLKISRREGESLVDYAHRLAAALKSLTSAQRAVLEQGLVQLMRGITLRMLAEILENPLGPEAARLSAYMETGQFPDRDPAARAVVSSYRQNAASDLWAGLPASARLPSSRPGTLPSTAGPQTVAAALPRVEAALPDVAGEAVSSERRAAGEPVLSGSAPPRMSSPQQSPHAEPAVAAKPDPAEGQAPASREAGTPARTASLAASAAPSPDEPVGSDTSIPERRTGAATQSAGNLPRTEASRSAPIGGAVVIYDAPALARMAQRLEEGKLPPQGIRYLADRMPGGSPPATGSVVMNASPPPGTSLATAGTIRSPDPAAENSDLSGSMPEKPIAPASANIDPTTGAPTTVHVSPAPNSVREGGVEMLIEQALFFPMAVPMIAREGLVPAFVAYPPVSVQPDDDERDVERLAPVDEDGEGRHSGHDPREEGKEDAPADNEREGEQAADQDRPDEAQDLYWRMADLA